MLVWIVYKNNRTVLPLVLGQLIYHGWLEKPDFRMKVYKMNKFITSILT